MLKYYVLTTTVCISKHVVILLYMGQCSRGYSHNLSAPSQKSVTTDSKLLKTIYKLFIMKENRCFLPIYYASTTTFRGGSRKLWVGGSSLSKQGRSPWSRDEVPSGGWVWEGGVPPPYLEENLNYRLFRCLLTHSKLHIIMCIVHTKRANIWHPMKPDLCCDT